MSDQPLDFDHLDRSVASCATFVEIEHEIRAFWRSWRPIERHPYAEYLREATTNETHRAIR